MKKALSITYLNNRWFVLLGVVLLAMMNVYSESSITILAFECVYWLYFWTSNRERNEKYHLSSLGVSEKEWFLAHYLKTVFGFFLLLGFYYMLDVMFLFKAPSFVEIFLQISFYFFLLCLLEALNIHSIQDTVKNITSILILVMISAFYLMIVLSFLDKLFFPMERYALVITAYFIYLAFLFIFLVWSQKVKDISYEINEESYFIGVHVQDTKRFIHNALKKENANLLTADQIHFNSIKMGTVAQFYDRNYPQFNLRQFQEAISLYSLPCDKKIRKWSLGMKKRMLISLYESFDSEVFIFDNIDQGLDPFVLQKALKRVQNKAYGRGERIYILNPSTVWNDILDEEIFFDGGVLDESE